MSAPDRPDHDPKPEAAAHVDRDEEVQAAVEAEILQLLGDGLAHFEGELLLAVRTIPPPEDMVHRARDRRLVAPDAALEDVIRAGAQSWAKDALNRLQTRGLVRPVQREGKPAWCLTSASEPEPPTAEPRITSLEAVTSDEAERVAWEVLDRARPAETKNRRPLRDEFYQALLLVQPGDRGLLLREGAKVFGYRLPEAERELAHLAANQALAPVFEPFDGWLTELRNVTGQWRRPDEAELVLPLRDLASVLVKADPLTREIGEAEALDRLKRLGLPERRARELLDAALEAAVARADTAELDPAEVERRLAELRVAAAPVLAHPDPLVLYREAIGDFYGGDRKVPELVCIATVTRVLKQREGTMPCHTLILGPSSAGKNHALKAALRLLPDEAYVKYDAGSARILVYDARPVAHRCIVFLEQDSIPKDVEDNPAASAVRSLLQENELTWQVVEYDAETHSHYVRVIKRRGPSVLITTSTRSFREQRAEQLDTRVLTLEVVSDAQQIRAALKAQARAERHGLPSPPAELIAFQELLGLLGPWDVTLPFAGQLAEALGRALPDPRVLRDYLKIISLVKAVAVVRHAHRQRDEQGRLVATLSDYRTIFDLVASMYEDTTTGATDLIRRAVEVVRAVANARSGGATIREVGRALGLSGTSAWRCIRAALRNQWLVNLEERKYRPARLDVGDPMPEQVGLPRPEQLGALENSEICEIVKTSEFSRGIPVTSEFSFQFSPAPPTPKTADGDLALVGGAATLAGAPTSGSSRVATASVRVPMPRLGRSTTPTRDTA